MSRWRWFWRLAAVGALVMGGVAVLQNFEGERLRVELESLRAQGARLGAVRAENARLRAAQISAAELETLRADHAALPRLRAEIEALRKRIEASRR